MCSSQPMPLPCWERLFYFPARAMQEQKARCVYLHEFDVLNPVFTQNVYARRLMRRFSYDYCAITYVVFNELGRICSQAV